MSDKPILQPGPDHPITIEPNPARVVVKVAGRVLVDTQNSVTLREADYPPVEYVPLSEIDASLLEATDNVSYCPYKGRRELLQHSRRWRALRQRRLGVQSAVSARRRARRARRILSRPRRVDRAADTGGAIRR